MYDSILVPTDGSGAAETAAETAIALAQRFDASLHAIHVLELDKIPNNVEAEASARLTQLGEATLATVSDRAGDADVSVTTDVVESAEPVHQSIVDYAEVHGVDLIAMGTHGRSGLDRLILGSVAERTIRTSPMPVLTVKEDVRLDPDFETVLVPVDGSTGATAAADHGIALAEANDAALHVVHVVDVTALWGDGGSTVILDALEEAGQQAVDDVIERAEEVGLRSIEASVLTGTPVRAIVAHADERDADLIVMGTHGRTGLDRFLLGSVTEHVIRRSERPVLTIGTPDKQ